MHEKYFSLDNAKFTQAESFLDRLINAFTFCFDIILLVFLLALRFPFPGLYAVLPHGQGSVDTVQLEVEAAGIAHGLALVVSPPERGVGCPAVCAAQTHPPG